MKLYFIILCLLIQFTCFAQNKIMFYGNRSVFVKSCVYTKNDVIALTVNEKNENEKFEIFNKASIFKILLPNDLFISNNKLLKMKSSDIEIERISLMLGNKNNEKVSNVFKDIEIANNSNNSIIFSEVILVNGIDKNELYNRAKMWFVKAFVSSKAVLELDDKDNGQLVGKATIPGFETINYTIEIYIKDGRFKYNISNFQHSKFGLITNLPDNPIYDNLGKKNYDKLWVEAQKKVEYEAIVIKKSLNNIMLNRTEVQKSDW